ncbi:hypothetical protein SAPIO_CDS2236 [Scedosporium apiospermum]|uniref:Rhodopsin domain-containing protein n=1 Tax=Pseudallescheria apiosperma TaxID=563466 RepID=A0A084GC35_PSEDA|nr:uncharacterized protein SAPIO_CDS2236 [Scedosporium apiospermum]KEZ44897.1 hypothetical protein SAPIO_CDS2236 [Scedosporium apiospermum]
MSSPGSTDDYGPVLNGTIWLLTALAACFLILRAYLKLRSRRALWWDDYVLIISLITLVASSALQSVCVSLGFGKHNADIPAAEFQSILLLGNAAGFASILAAMWSKTSFAMTLLGVSKGWAKCFIWFIIISVHIVLGANATIQWIQCWPIEKYWEQTIPGKCWPRLVLIEYNIFAAGYSGTMDIVLSLLPWRLLRNVAINKKEKIRAIFALSLGIFAGITSYLKIITIPAIGSNDIIDAVGLLIFGTAESAITIMAVSIPVVRTVLLECQDSRRQLIQGIEGKLDDSTDSFSGVEEGKKPEAAIDARLSR